MSSRRKSLLTDRQAGIAYCVYSGMSNEQIVRWYHLSPNTVKQHLSNITKKLGVFGRLELVLWYWLHAIIGKE